MPLEAPRCISEYDHLGLRYPPWTLQWQLTASRSTELHRKGARFAGPCRHVVFGSLLSSPFYIFLLAYSVSVDTIKLMNVQEKSSSRPDVLPRPLSDD